MRKKKMANLFSFPFYNIHSLSQLLALLGQIIANPETVNCGRAFSNRQVNCICKSPHLAGGTDVARDGPLPRLSEGQILIGKGSRRRWQIIYTKSQGRFEECSGQSPSQQISSSLREKAYERGVGLLVHSDVILYAAVAFDPEGDNDCSFGVSEP